MNEPQEQYYRAPGELAPRIYEYVLAGLLLAVAGGGVLGYHVYHGFIVEDIERETAYWGIGIPFVGLAAGIYIFAYGWQRGDIEKAIRMSMWLSLGALGIVAAVLGTLALKRSVRGGFSFPFVAGTSRRQRTGWYFGTGDDDYDDGPDLSKPIFGERGRDYGASGGIEIHCTNCGELFLPQAPGGYCPRCGHSAVGRPRQTQERRKRRA